MSEFRIGLLQCGHVHSAVVGSCGDYPELYRDLFGPLGASIKTYRVDQGEIPEDPAECDGWLISPSRASVTDQLPWLNGAERFVKEALDRHVGTVGVCFGHQLIAQATGGKVERGEHGWSVGLKRYQVIADQPFAQRGEHIDLIASHEDQVVVAPQDANVWLTTTSCPVAGFTLGTALALQPHVEFTCDISRQLIHLRRDLMDDDTITRANASLDGSAERHRLASWIMSFFEACDTSR